MSTHSLSRYTKRKIPALVCAWAFGFTLIASSASTANAQAASCPVEVLSTPIYWNMDRLSTVKSKIAADGSNYKTAYEKLISDADKALSKAPYTVTDKTKPGPSGDLKDYVSLARYYWPNPKKADGQPYIRKDGRTNPEINSVDFDRRRSQHMTNDVTSLALAAYFTGNKAYAEKAESFVRAWFLDKDTGMNPHLNFAQNVPGVTSGREFGILDTRIYWDVMDSLLLLQSERMIEPSVVNELRGWFGKYANWLVTSEFGQKASSKKNNHGVYYDAQLSHILMFAGRCDLAKKIVEKSHDRTKKQIDKTGLMPEEKKRTQSLFYHAFNLRAFLRLAYYAERLDVGFYDDAKKGAGSVKNSVDFVASYAGRVEDWPYEEINTNIEKSLWSMLVHAQLLDDSQSIKDAIAALEYDPTTDQTNLILGLTPN